tara:strand:+ start:67 stop:270 length:204 start_codon:yes stop_codon:yes gene_type:complete
LPTKDLFEFISQGHSSNRFGIVEPVTRCTKLGLKRRAVCQSDKEKRKKNVIYNGVKLTLIHICPYEL